MTDVPTLHLRNVPPTLYERVRELAKRDGISMNAKAIQLLQGAIVSDGTDTDWWSELLKLREEWDLPADTPKPEAIVRAHRDASAR